MATAPGHTFWIPVPWGSLRESTQDPLQFLLQSRERFGDVVKVRLGPIVTHFLFHPDHVSRVLRDQQKNYLRGWHYNFLRRLLGENLVVSEGDFWRRQRRLAQPAFHHHMLAAYAKVMIDTTSTMIRNWENEAARGGTVEVASAMSRLAFEIAGRAFFGQDVSGASDAIRTSFAKLAAYLDFRFKHRLTSPPVSWPTPRNRQFKRAKQDLIDIVLLQIRQHRHESAGQQDLLSMLIEAQDEETGERMTDQEICVEALTFLIAGHETTAKGLTWTLSLLASNPAIRERLHAEVETVLGKDGPTLGTLPQLVSTRMAIQESLRLYPPVWALTRQAVVDDEINGYHIPANSSVALIPYVTHRHPEFWPRPDVFDMDRFTIEQAEKRPKGAYFPFIFGPHQCIGMEFAMQEMCLVIAMVLERFDFHLPPGQTIRPVAALTLNPSGPVRITIDIRR